MFGRAIVAFTFVWLMAPHEPDVGLSNAAAVRARQSSSTLEAVREGLNYLHDAALARVEQVRVDFRTNLSRPASPPPGPSG